MTWDTFFPRHLSPGWSKCGIDRQRDDSVFHFRGTHCSYLCSCLLSGRPPKADVVFWSLLARATTDWVGAEVGAMRVVVANLDMVVVVVEPKLDKVVVVVAKLDKLVVVVETRWGIVEVVEVQKIG